MKSATPVNRQTTVVWTCAALSSFALLGGVLTLLGWALDIPRLTDWDDSGISQMPNNALGVLSAGVAVLMLLFGRLRIGATFGAFAGLIGAATLFQHITGIDLGIDTLLIYRDWGQRGTVVPGRMGVPGAMSLTVIGISIVLASFAPTRRLAVVGGLLTMGGATLSLVGYLFGADPLYTIPKLTVIALQTAIMLFALGLGLVVSMPEAQPMKLLLEDTAAAALVRRALPAFILLPMLVGLLRLFAQQAGLFDTAFGVAVLVLMSIALLTGLLWWMARAVQIHETAMREAHDRLAGILGSITDAFYTLDRNWHFVSVNDEVVRRFSKPRDQIVGEHIWKMFPAAVGGEAHVQLGRAMAERAAVEYEVFYAPWQRWFADRAYPTADGGLAVYSRDITSRKQADEELRRLAAELRDADQRKDEFLATLAHELRNPLAPIRNSVELIKRWPTNGPVMDQVRKMMERQVGQLARLVDDLLDIGRIRNNKLELRRERVDLCVVIQHAQEAAAVLAAAAQQHLTVSLTSEPIYIYADPLRLVQVFVNLLNNACKYSDPGGRIELTIERQKSEVVVSIRDTGFGIPSDMLAKVFDMFTQVDQPSERSYGGLGIGLTLVRRLVELHEGTVTAHSEGVGRGSTFVVRLPVLTD